MCVTSRVLAGQLWCVSPEPKTAVSEGVYRSVEQKGHCCVFLSNEVLLHVLAANRPALHQVPCEGQSSRVRGCRTAEWLSLSSSENTLL